MAKTKSTTSKTTAPAAPKAAEAVKPQAAEAPKKEEVTKTVPAKESAPKPPIAKSAAPKKETPVKSSVILQINGIDFDPAKIQDDAVQNAKKIKADVKDVKVYVKPEEAVAYFTIDGEGSEDYKILL